MTRFIFIYLLLLVLGSCKKSEPTGVMISIDNNTSFTLDSVKLIYDTTNYNYGTILPGSTTGYVFFKSMPDAPAAKATLENKKILAGYVIPPNSYPISTLANGRYILQIFPDSTLFYRYNAKFIKN